MTRSVHQAKLAKIRESFQAGMNAQTPEDWQRLLTLTLTRIDKLTESIASEPAWLDTGEEHTKVTPIRKPKTGGKRKKS
jgi:hypothetical protein